MEVNDRPGVTDPIWDALLESRLRPYVPAVRRWWETCDEFTPLDTGSYAVNDAPPGLFARFTRTPVRSPIKGVQAFPYVPTGFLQISGVQGGAIKMIDRLCMDGAFKLDEFTIVVKGNLPATYTQGQILAFIPTLVYEDRTAIGKWVYLTNNEMLEMIVGTIPLSVGAKLALKL